MSEWTAPPIWKNGECWILGGGTSLPYQFGVPEDVVYKVTRRELPVSAYSPYLEPLHSRNVIGINNSYMLGDWLDCLFFGDCGWYNVHRLAIAKLSMLKVTCCNRFEQKSEANSEGIRYLGHDESALHGISANPKRVCWNRNSGAAAISLAAHFGCIRIILLGFDMTLDSTNTSHWFGYHDHKPKTVHLPFNRHLQGFAAIKRDADERGIEILNASPISKITEFKKVNALDLLEEGA